MLLCWGNIPSSWVSCERGRPLCPPCGGGHDVSGNQGGAKKHDITDIQTQAKTNQHKDKITNKYKSKKFGPWNSR